VRGLILSASFLRFPRPELRPLRFALRTPVIGALRALRRLPVWLGRGRRDAWRQAKAETWARVPARMLAARVRAILDVDVRAALRDCHQNVLCLAYADDDVVPARHAEEIAATSARVRAHTLPGGHLGIRSDAGAAARTIADFIADQGNPCASAPTGRSSTFR
jgi:pimeloyl-ACP methyl ester carboxylesterase